MMLCNIWSVSRDNLARRDTSAERVTALRILRYVTAGVMMLCAATAAAAAATP